MKNNFVFRWIYNTYLFVFARPYFQKINEVIFRIIIGPLGFMNYSGDFRLTGERRLFQKLSILNFEIVIDIGANKGDWAEMVLKEAPISKVYAFEPQKSEFDKLIKLSKNHPSRLFPYNLALGDAEKDIEIHIHDTSSELSYIDNHLNQLPLLTGKSSTSESIKMTLFDTFIESKQDEFKVINFIKIDTEGYEYEVLKGSVEVLKKTKLILFEHHYDNMIIKNYTFKQINNFLILNSFKKVFKAKMPFRKTFEYIYENARKL